MNERSRAIFMELYVGLPRQGPGNRVSAEKALAFMDGLPPSPAALDPGCGTGAQNHAYEFFVARRPA